MDEDAMLYRIYLSIRRHQQIIARKRQLVGRTNATFEPCASWEQRYDLKRKKFSV